MKEILKFKEKTKVNIVIEKEMIVCEIIYVCTLKNAIKLEFFLYELN